MNMPDLIAQWQHGREALRVIAEAEHPPIVDPHGRTWTWVAGNLYRHDDALCVPEHYIATAGIPGQALVDSNANYSNLCDICRGVPR